MCWRGWHNSVKLWDFSCRATQGRTDHSEEFQQNVTHWRSAWPTAPVSLLWEPHELHKKANRYDIERSARQVGRCPILLLGKSGGHLLIAPERMKLRSLRSQPRMLPKKKKESNKTKNWLSGPVVQNPAANAGDTDGIPDPERPHALHQLCLRSRAPTAEPSAWDALQLHAEKSRAQQPTPSVCFKI